MKIIKEMIYLLKMTIKSVEIRKDEINNYRSENSNNMEEPPAPGLFDEQF